MNWQAMFTTLAILLGIATLGTGITWLVAWDFGDNQPTAWLMSLFLATLLSAALAAGLSK